MPRITFGAMDIEVCLTDKVIQWCVLGVNLGLRSVDQGADDEAAESGVWLWVGGWITIGFLAVDSKFLLPFGAEFGGVQDDRGLVDSVLESRDGALTFFEQKYRNYMIYTVFLRC